MNQLYGDIDQDTKHLDLLLVQVRYDIPSMAYSA
jgi:hypothetical protein